MVLISSWDLQSLCADSFLDRYVVSQLIMVSHDILAQYWEEFGHVSFYKRIDLTDYLSV